MCAYGTHIHEPTHTEAHTEPHAYTFTFTHSHLHLHTTPPSHCCFMMDGTEDARGRRGERDYKAAYMCVCVCARASVCVGWNRKKKGEKEKLS